MTPRLSFAIAALIVVSLAASACAPDESDVYAVEDDGPPPTRAPLPSTTIPTTLAGAPEPPATATFLPNGELVEVRALDNTFRVETIEVAAGTEVLWKNGGRNDHDVLPVDDALDWGVPTDGFTPGDEYSHVFDTPGVYPYYCSIHGTKEVGMVGMVIVTEPGS